MFDVTPAKYEAVASGAAAGSRAKYRAFHDYDAAVAWVDAADSGSVSEIFTDVILYTKFPRVAFV